MKTYLFILALSCCYLTIVTGKGIERQNVPCDKEYNPYQTYAIVVGVSNYQDPEIPDLKYAARDAASFAAFLQSPSGGGVPRENIQLLTNADATYARFGAALDWLLELAIPAEQVLIYVAGYGDSEGKKNEAPGYFLLADSPLAPLRAGAFEVKQIEVVLKNVFHTKSPNYLFVANVFPLILSDGRGYEVVKVAGKERADFPHSFAHRTIQPADLQSTPEKMAQSKITLNNLLLDALLGFADKNKDEVVNWNELKRFIRRSPDSEKCWPGLLFLAVGDHRQPIVEVDRKVLEKLKDHSDGLFPSIIHLETSQREGDILKEVPEAVKMTYADFIVALKLGHLLEPEQHCASFFYDQLMVELKLEKLHQDLRRKLAAALLEEVQQALNAYIRMDNAELNRRDKMIEPYQRYTEYMARSIELFGTRKFMSKTLLVKYHYFKGLVARMEAVENASPEKFDEAIAQQQKALVYENAAAFVYNELGVIYDHQGKWQLAEQQFETAIDLSPNWSIPYSNRCIIFTKKEDSEKAIQFGKKAFRLSPRNVMVINTLATALMLGDDLKTAAKLLDLALRIDPKNSLAYYNRACIHALSGETEAALVSLDQALQNGFSDLVHIQQDADFDSIRSTKSFQKLLKNYLSYTDE